MSEKHLKRSLDVIASSGDAVEAPRVIEPGHTFGSVTDQISAIVLTQKPKRGWILGFILTFMLANAFFAAAGYTILRGIGVWGNNIPVAWGFGIINFVWWIGIGHAGTFISAFLLLLRQDWRTSINRFAEAMTLFAVACAGMYPLLHLGRPWLFYWLMPYPNVMNLWPQFRSPLVWDVFAVSTYATISLLFWYVGLIPDLATLRDRTRHRVGKYVYGFMSMGWRGSALHWHRYQTAYLLLAGLAAPLVVSVHSVVGMDFAGSQLPGWHNTIFPPYFVAGAIFSGFAMVVTLAIPLRKYYGLGDFVTIKHIDNSGKLMLVTGLIVAYGYITEIFMGWYSGNEYESFMVINRMTGPYAWSFWLLILCNVIIPQCLWSRSFRQNVSCMFVLSIIVNIGMWLERFVIIVTSLTREFLPSSWGNFSPTYVDISMFAGTIGLFLCMFLLFIRFLPVISIFEMRELVHDTSEEKEIQEEVAAVESPG